MNSSTGPERDFEHAKLLMQEYSFDLAGFEPGELVAIWQERLGAEPSWIRAAVLEALYLGRYKAFSVEQILQGWKRRGHPVRHFNSEFERVVFGPIDPVASKYAAMTSFSPSQLMASQPDSQDEAASCRDLQAPPPNSDYSPVAVPLVAPEAPLTHVDAQSPEPDSPAESSAGSSDEPPDESSTGLSLGGNTPSTKNFKAQSTTAIKKRLPPSVTSFFHQPEPIQKFTPEPKSSEFYQRLQAVARQFE